MFSCKKAFKLKEKEALLKKWILIFLEMEKILNKITDGKFPFSSISKITIEHVKPIIAPSYILYPETTEKEQIEKSKKTYGI